MIPTYRIEDFFSRQSVENSFKLERFENTSWPTNLTWPHRYDFYEIIWVTEGEFMHTVDYHDITIRADTLLLISPGQIYSVELPEQVKGYSISFTEEFLLANHTQKSIFELTFLAASYTRPYLCLDAAARQELAAIIDPMLQEVSRAVKTPLIINGLLLVLLNRIQRLMHAAQLIPADPLVDSYQVLVHKRFKNLLEKHYNQEVSLAFYADKLAISGHHLTKIIKKVTGKTAGLLIRDRRLMEAKRMLVYCPLSIGDVSEELRFKDFSYFSRQFKKQEGLSPAEYRKRMHAKYLNK